MHHHVRARHVGDSTVLLYYYDLATGIAGDTPCHVEVDGKNCGNLKLNYLLVAVGGMVNLQSLVTVAINDSATSINQITVDMR